jgi:hypothetical protein
MSVVSSADEGPWLVVQLSDVGDAYSGSHQPLHFERLHKTGGAPSVV